eukprot:CAMPEP_0117452204 /NCGR_PEP_ID=MMETSP0759-20121206/9477_1 /TAXON_ID=63605 /ORGANISM="Percolomonas cosmopolitus, Strain WS" /LENGTH=1871 /DNA_ID=CAMNT_0005244977 /DNA_START=220 /DNA_END=5835 /DNA_ORIENTATION=+
MGSIVSKKSARIIQNDGAQIEEDRLVNVQTNKRVTNRPVSSMVFSNIFDVSGEGNKGGTHESAHHMVKYALTGSIYASYVPAPILHLRSESSFYHNQPILSAPSLEIVSSLSFPIASSHLAMLMLKITFKPFEGHKKDINAYVAALNSYIGKISNIVTQWSGYLWKIEGSDRIYCLFGDFAQHASQNQGNDASRISPSKSPSNVSGRNESSADEKIPESAVKATRFAVLCAHDLASSLNNYSDRALGVKFNLHLVITAGSDAQIVHFGGVQDKWCPLILMDGQHNSTLLSNQAHALIEDDVIKMSPQEYEKSEHRTRIEQLRMDQTRREKAMNDEAAGILQGWISKRNSSQANGSTQKTEQNQIPALRIRSPEPESMYDQEVDDLGSVFDSDEEREYLELSARKKNEVKESRFPQVNSQSPIQLKRFHCKLKHDAWQVEYAFSGDSQLKSDVSKAGFLSFLSSKPTSFTDRATYMGYLSDHQIARIEAQMSRVPQHIILSLMAIKFPHAGSLSEMDVEQMQNVMITIQKMLLQHNGCVQDIRVDSFSNLIVMAEFGLEIHSDRSSAHRAVSCAKDIESILERHFDNDSTPSIGIATGYVYVCEIGSPMRKAYILLGDTTSLCVDLTNASSKTFGILVDEHTFLATKQRVSYYTSLKPLFRNNKEEFVYSPAFVGDNMISRSEELQEIITFIDQWYSGEAAQNSILIKGELGVGKSMMVQSILANCAQNKLSTLLAEGSVLTKEIALFPFRSLFLKLFGKPSSDVMPYYSHVASRFGATKCGGEYQYLLNMILPVNFPQPEHYRHNREFLLQFFTDLISSLTIDRQICVLHDVHHFDELSLELVRHIHSKLPSHMLFISITDVGSHTIPSIRFSSDVSEPRIIDILSDFDEYHTKQLICRLMRSQDCEESIVAFEQLHSRGHPLYIKELTLLLSARHFIHTDTELCTRVSPSVSTLDELKSQIPSQLYSIIRERVLLQKELRQQILQYSAFSQCSLTLGAMAALISSEYRDQLPVILRELEENQLLESVGEAVTEPHFTIENDLLRQVVLDLATDNEQMTIHENLANYFLKVVKENRDLQSSLMPHVCHHTVCAVEKGAQPLSLMTLSLQYQVSTGTQLRRLSLPRQSFHLFNLAQTVIIKLQEGGHAIDMNGKFTDQKLQDLNLQVSFGLLVSSGEESIILSLCDEVCSMCGDDVVKYVIACIVRGLLHLVNQDSEAAQSSIEQALERAKNDSVVDSMRLSLCALSLVQLTRGMFVEASETCAQCMDKDSDPSFSSMDSETLGIDALVRSLQTFAFACQGKFEAATKNLNDTPSKSGGYSLSQRLSMLISLLPILSFQLHRNSASELLDKLHGLRETCHINWRCMCQILSMLFQIPHSSSSPDERAILIQKTRDHLRGQVDGSSSVLFLPVLISLFVDCLLSHDEHLDEAERWLVIARNHSQNHYHMFSSVLQCQEAEVVLRKQSIESCSPEEKDESSTSRDRTTTTTFIVRNRFTKAVEYASQQGAFALHLKVLVKWYEYEQESQNRKLIPESTPTAVVTHDMRTLTSQQIYTQEQLQSLLSNQREIRKNFTILCAKEAEMASRVREITLLVKRRNEAMQRIQQSIEDKRNHPSLAQYRKDVVGVKELSSESTRELFSLKRPSRSVKLLIQACCVLKDIQRPVVEASPSKEGTKRRTPLDSYWAVSRAAMQEDNFFNVVDLDIGSVTSFKLDKVKKILSDSSDFNEEDVVKMSIAAERLLIWLRSVMAVHDIQSSLVSQIRQLEKKRVKTNEIVKSLAKLRVEHAKLDKEKDSAEEKVHIQQLRLDEILNKLIWLGYERDSMEGTQKVHIAPSLDDLRQQIKECLNKIDVSEDTSIDFVVCAQRIAQDLS